MKYHIKYSEPFYYLMVQRKFLWWTYWGYEGEYSADLSDMEELYSKLTK